MKEGTDRVAVFNGFVGEILGRLLKSFPAPGTIPYLPRGSFPDPFLDEEEYRLFLRHTVAWLLREGIVRAAGLKRGDDIGDVAIPELLSHASTSGMLGNHFVLSAQAIAALDVKLTSLDGETARAILAKGDQKSLEKAGGTVAYWLGRLAGGMVDSQV
jgi:hypothetical protein